MAKASRKQVAPAPTAATWSDLAHITQVPTGNALELIRQSGLPGTEKIEQDGTWPETDRIRFLKTLCGQKP